MFLENFRLFISGAESQEQVQPEFNQPYVPVNKANGGQIEQIIHDVSTYFHIY